MPRLIPLATLFVATWMLAGCGSGSSKARLSHEEYLQRIRAIEAGRHARAVDQLFFKLVTEPPMPKATCLARAREFDSHLHGVVNEVASLSPPRSIQSLQDRFVSAARDTTEVVDHAVSDVQSGTLTCGMPMNRRIYGLPSTQRVEGVLQELRTKGYRIGLNGE